MNRPEPLGANIKNLDDARSRFLELCEANTSESERDIAEARTLLRHFPELINPRSSRLKFPLHEAARHGKTKICGLLLDAGADIDGEDDRKHTPLHFAISTRKMETCEFLIHRHANIHARSYGQRTPLHRAAIGGHGDVCSLLIANGADVEARDDEGKIPLHEATNDKACLVLLARGADPKALDDEGNEAFKDAERLAQWLPTLKNPLSKHFQSAKPSRRECFVETSDRKRKLHYNVMVACVTGDFGRYIAAPLIASTEKSDRQLFADVWQALPKPWRDEYQALRLAFAKAGGLTPLIGPHTAALPPRDTGGERGVAP